MNYTITYYSEMVQRDVKALPPDILADYFRLTDLLKEFGPQLGMPHSRAMGDGLFELRPKGKQGIGRVFYCFMIKQRVVVIHSFIKKTQETPKRELAIAKQRIKELKNANP